MPINIGSVNFRICDFSHIAVGQPNVFNSRIAEEGAGITFIQCKFSMNVPAIDRLLLKLPFFGAGRQ